VAAWVFEGRNKNKKERERGQVKKQNTKRFNFENTDVEKERE